MGARAGRRAPMPDDRDFTYLIHGQLHKFALLDLRRHVPHSVLAAHADDAVFSDLKLHREPTAAAAGASADVFYV